MSAWVGIVTSYLPEIVQLAKPLFTRARPQEKAPDVLEKQIVELQNAATLNAESINKLALDMQKTIDALQLGAAAAERRLQSAHTLAVVALTVAVLAFGVAVYMVAR